MNLSDVRESPVITARVDVPLRHQPDQTMDKGSFQIDFVLTNHSPRPVNVKNACAAVCVHGGPIICAADGCRLFLPPFASQDDNRVVHAESWPFHRPTREAALVCLTLDIEEDDGGYRSDRILVPRLKNGTVELVDYREDTAAGQRWLLKRPIGHNVGPVTLLSEGKRSWIARDDRGDELEILSDWLLPTGMVPLGE